MGAAEAAAGVAKENKGLLTVIIVAILAGLAYLFWAAVKPAKDLTDKASKTAVDAINVLDTAVKDTGVVVGNIGGGLAQNAGVVGTFLYPANTSQPSPITAESYQKALPFLEVIIAEQGHENSWYSIQDKAWAAIRVQDAATKRNVPATLHIRVKNAATAAAVGRDSTDFYDGVNLTRLELTGLALPGGIFSNNPLNDFEVWASAPGYNNSGVVTVE